jgi:hypothetical protein
VFPDRIIVLLALALAACRDPATVKREQTLSHLIGADESAVIRELGPPTRSFDQGALRTLVFERTDVEFVPGMGGPGPHTAAFHCRIQLTLEDGRVRSFDQQGAGC